MKAPVFQLLTGAIMAFLCLIEAPARGLELWVSPSGKDGNPGTRSAPFASLDRALQTVREARKTPGLPEAGGIQITLRSGLYFPAAPIRLTAEDSGTDRNPTVIAAAPEETPVLSAGLQITNWTPTGALSGLPEASRGKIWVATLPRIGGSFFEFRQLWVNGSKAIRAREPNGDKLAPLMGWDRSNEVATIPASVLDGMVDPGRMEMIIDQVWEIAVLRVKTVQVKGASARLTFRQPESRIEFTHPWPPVIVKTNYHAPFFLANAVQFLDSPGEWFEDLDAGKIYYWPRPGENLSHAKVFAPVLDTLVNIEGTLDQPVSNITFRGITFSHTTWLRPSEQGHVPLQAGMFMLDAKKLSPKGTPYHRGLDNLAWIGRPPGAVSIKNASYISFEDCVFEHVASAGLDFQSGTHDDLVQGCRFRDIGGNGMQLGKFSDTNVETHFPYNPSDEREICANERIADNLITDCANEDWGCVGIGAGYVRGVNIEHNEVSNCSYTGISLGWGWTKMTNALRDNSIHANYIHHVATRLGDTAGIYSLSAQPGTIISENAVDDIKMSPYVPDPDHWFYLYLDEGSSFVTVRDNWCAAEKFLKNANGPGNVWDNNGPQVSTGIRNAAGLEPAYRKLLNETNSP